MASDLQKVIIALRQSANSLRSIQDRLTDRTVAELVGNIAQDLEVLSPQEPVSKEPEQK